MSAEIVGARRASESMRRRSSAAAALVNRHGHGEAADEELLRRFNQGDQSAFRALVERYRRPLFNFILRHLRDRDRSEEILQDVFLKVVERSGEFKGESKFSTWLYTIARNLCIDTSRKLVFRRHKSLDAPSAGSDGEGPSMLDRTAGTDLGAERGAISAQLQLRITAAIEALPDDQREVFLLRELQNMPFKEIGDIVGAPENTVKSRMRYALERLQEALSEYGDHLQSIGTGPGSGAKG